MQVNLHSHTLQHCGHHRYQKDVLGWFKSKCC